MVAFNLEKLVEHENGERQIQILLWYIEGKIDENGWILPGQSKARLPLTVILHFHVLS
jgi:hypothetical protein